MSIYEDLISGVRPAEEAHVWNALKGTKNKNPDKLDRVKLDGTEYEIQILRYRRIGGYNRDYDVIDPNNNKKFINLLCNLDEDIASLFLKEKEYTYTPKMIKDFLKYVLQFENPSKFSTYKHANPELDKFVDSALTSLGYTKRISSIDEDEYEYIKK